MVSFHTAHVLVLLQVNALLLELFNCFVSFLNLLLEAIDILLQLPHFLLKAFDFFHLFSQHLFVLIF